MSTLPETAKNLYMRLCSSYPSHMRIARFIISGGTATGANLGTLFVLTHFLDVWYLFSSIMAFGVSFLISFTLQKIWTFESASMDGVHIQAFLFLSILLVGLAVNTVLLYLLVEYAHVHYILAQLMVGALIAVMNYLSYRSFVFPVHQSRDEASRG